MSEKACNAAREMENQRFVFCVLKFAHNGDHLFLSGPLIKKESEVMRDIKEALIQFLSVEADIEIAKELKNSIECIDKAIIKKKKVERNEDTK